MTSTLTDLAGLYGVPLPRRRRRVVELGGGRHTHIDRGMATARAGRGLTGSSQVDLTDPNLYPGRDTSQSPAPQRALFAAIVAAEDYAPKGGYQFGAKSTRPQVQPWQTRVFELMRTGNPGFVRPAVVMYADVLAAGAKLVMQRQRTRAGRPTGEWETVETGPEVTVLNRWRGLDESQADLIHRYFTFADSVGEMYHALRKRDGDWYYTLDAPSAVELDMSRRVAVLRGVPGAKAGDRWYEEVPIWLVDHVFLSDDEWRGVPTSQMQRALPAVEDWRHATHTVRMLLRSRLVMSRLLWAKATPESGVNWPEEMARWARLALDWENIDNLSPEQLIAMVAPFPMQTAERPELIDLRPQLDQELGIRDAAWRDFAESIDAPTRAVVEGPGSANHWSAFLERDLDAIRFMASRMQRLASTVYHAHWRPWHRYLQLPGNPADWRVWYELPDVRADKSSDVLALRDTGVVTRQAVAQAAGLTSGDMPALPPGITDLEMQVIMRHGRTLDAIIAEGEAAKSRPAGVPDTAGRLAPGVNPPSMPPTPTARQLSTPPRGAISAAVTAAGPGPFPAETGSWSDLVPRSTAKGEA